MFHRGDFPYYKAPGYQAVMIPYSLGEFFFLALVPDDTNGLAALEKRLSPTMLSESGFANRDLNLFLPKFKIEPPAALLSEALRELGMSTAFDSPPKSANFDGIAARTPDDYLYISEVIHKTYISLDEVGTEAAAATAVIMAEGSAFDANPPQPIDLRIERPFIYAVIHRPSKAVLFLGKVVDPR